MIFQLKHFFWGEFRLLCLISEGDRIFWKILGKKLVMGLNSSLKLGMPQKIANLMGKMVINQWM